MLFPRIFFRCTEERSGLRDEVCREKRPERGSKEAEYKSKRGKFKQALKLNVCLSQKYIHPFVMTKQSELLGVYNQRNIYIVDNQRPAPNI